MTEHLHWAQPGDAAAVAGAVAAVVAQPGPRRIAVPGGATPRAVFGQLAERSLDWSQVTIVPTDDRRVPPEHPASNLGALQRALSATGARLVALAEGDRPEPFDLVWLGMGEDGHVASLFPTMTATAAEGPAVIATVPEPLPPASPFPRLSLNLPALTAADRIIVAITGEAKRQVVARAIAGQGDEPIRHLLEAATCPVEIFWSPT